MDPPHHAAAQQATPRSSTQGSTTADSPRPPKPPATTARFQQQQQQQPPPPPLSSASFRTGFAEYQRLKREAQAQAAEAEAGRRGGRPGLPRYLFNPWAFAAILIAVGAYLLVGWRAYDAIHLKDVPVLVTGALSGDTVTVKAFPDLLGIDPTTAQGYRLVQRKMAELEGGGGGGRKGTEWRVKLRGVEAPGTDSAIGEEARTYAQRALRGSLCVMFTVDRVDSSLVLADLFVLNPNPDPSGSNTHNNKDKGTAGEGQKEEKEEEGTPEWPRLFQELLLEHGYAWHYGDRREGLKQAMDRAVAGKKGLWGLEHRPVPPWVLRRQQEAERRQRGRSSGSGSGGKRGGGGGGRTHHNRH